MIILYLCMIFLSGYIISYLLNRFNIVKYSNFHIFELIMNNFVYGLLLISFYFFLYNILGLKYTFEMFIPIFILDILMLIRLLLDIKNKSFVLEFSKNKKNNLFNFILNLFIIIEFLYLFSNAYFNYANSPDEFSLWATESKKIFLLKGFTSLNSSTAISYPLGMILIYSGFFVLVGAIKTNATRLISTIILLLFYLCGVGRCKRKEYNEVLYKILFLIFILFNKYVFYISVSMYVDIIVMVLNSLGFLYLLDSLFENKKDYFIIFILFGIFNTVIKSDGIFLELIAIIVIIFLYILFKLFKSNSFKLSKEKVKYLIISVVLFLSIFGIYKFEYYNLLKNPVNYITDSKAVIHSIKFNYINSTLNNGMKQLFSNWSYVFLLSILVILILFNVYRNKTSKKDVIKLLAIGLCVIFNYLFLNLAYIYQFEEEGILSPSILRYMTRIVPLLFEIILILYYSIKQT